MMVGRTIFEDDARSCPRQPSQEVVLEVRNLNRGRVIRDVSFELRRGEILGFAGLVGAGRTEVARAIFGADPIDSGEILVHGKPVAHQHARATPSAHGIGYLSEDRKRYGLALGWTSRRTSCWRRFAQVHRRARLGQLQRSTRDGRRAVRRERWRSRRPSVQQQVKNLSGGNQQKVVIAKWLTADTDILIFDEPTRGIDVGAKSEIYQLLNDLAGRASRSS